MLSKHTVNVFGEELSVGELVYDLGAGLGQSLPAIAVGMATQGVGTMFGLGGTAAAVLVNTTVGLTSSLSAGGVAYNEGLMQGYTQYQALLYGAGTAATSMALSMVFETKAMARGLLPRTTLPKIVQNADNALQRVVKQFVSGSAASVKEGRISRMVDRGLRNLCFNENNEIIVPMEEELEAVFEDALLGGGESVMDLYHGKSGELDLDTAYRYSKMDPVQIEHQARLRDLDTYLAINGSLPEVMLDSNGNPIYALTDGGERRYGGADPGTTIAFDPWLLAERRVRIGLRDYLGNMDGVRLLPNKHTLDLDVPAFQTVEPYSNTAGLGSGYDGGIYNRGGNGYDGAGNGYTPLDNGGITPVGDATNGVNGLGGENSFQNSTFLPQPDSLPTTPDTNVPDWQPVEEGNVSKNAELSSPDSFTNEPNGGMVEEKAKAKEIEVYAQEKGVKDLPMTPEEIVRFSGEDLDLARSLIDAIPESYGDEGLSLAQRVEKYGLPEKPKPQSLSAYQTRIWYKWQESLIGERLDNSQPLESMARQAFEMRNRIRTQARNAMQDVKWAKRLFAGEGNKTFEDLIEKYTDRGCLGDSLWEEIIAAAMRSRDNIDRLFNMKKE